ncbi:Tmem163 [Columba livia]|nr:Tmem163 [Columba livia]
MSCRREKCLTVWAKEQQAQHFEGILLFGQRASRGFNSLVGGIMGFSILLSAEVFKHNSSVWFLDGSIGVLIGLTIFAYGIK